jgi:hypothetical protein
MSALLQKVYRDGSWWAERSDGTWVRWNDLDQAWIEAEPPNISGGAGAPPPPPDPGAASAPKVVDARVPEPEYVYVDYGNDRSLGKDIAHVYVFLAFFSAIALGNMALWFGPDLTSFFYGAPGIREVLEGTYERPPSPVPMMLICVAFYGAGIVAVLRGREDQWAIRLASIGLAMGIGLSLLGIALGWQNGFEPLRAVYYAMAFGIISFAYLAYRAWRGI